jgi:hypothetical protein
MLRVEMVMKGIKLSLAVVVMVYDVLLGIGLDMKGWEKTGIFLWRT